MMRLGRRGAAACIQTRLFWAGRYCDWFAYWYCEALVGKVEQIVRLIYAQSREDHPNRIERTCFMAQLQVQPGQYVAIEIAQKSRTRYTKALVAQGDCGRDRAQNGTALRSGMACLWPEMVSGSQVTPETGILVLLTPRRGATH